MSAPKLSLPPGPHSLIPGRILVQLRRDPLAFLTHVAHTYGPIATFRALGQRYVIISSPDLAREILMGPPDTFWKGPALQNSKGILGDALLTAEGDAHKQQRRLLQPAFHAKHVENYTPAILQSTQELIATLREKITTAPASSLDIRPEMMSLTLIIAGRALFGTFLADDVRIVHQSMDDLMNNFTRSVVPGGKILNYLPLPSTKKLIRAQQNLYAVVNRMIAERRSRLSKNTPAADTAPATKCPFPHTAPTAQDSPIKTQDLLSTMIAATDPESTGTRLSDNELRDQCITILTAGHETTANALTFTLYLLARHPEEQQKLREEIRAAKSNPSSLTTLDRTHWILSEAMRLYPPVWTMGRQNQKPVTLGGYNLPPKCTFLIPQWIMHRDPQYFPNPDAFTPDRWQNPTHPRFAYLPFSTGHRNCIGESFAWLEMLLALQLLISNFNFSLPSNTPDPALTPAITLRPKNPIELVIQPFKSTL